MRGQDLQPQAAQLTMSCLVVSLLVVLCTVSAQQQVLWMTVESAGLLPEVQRRSAYN